MPFWRLDEDLSDKAFSKSAPEDGTVDAERAQIDRGFVYESEGPAIFDLATLERESRVVYDLIIAAGATHVEVSYDGGNDEGWSHALAVWFGEGDRRLVERVAVELASPDATSRIRAAATFGSIVYEDRTDVQVLFNALDVLSGDFASALLPKGFGTGEYTAYGRLTADLRSGQVIDQPDAPMPADLDEPPTVRMSRRLCGDRES